MRYILTRLLQQISLNSIKVGGLHVLGRVLILLSGIVLGRALGPEGYGVYTFTIAILSVLSIVAAAGIPQLMLRDTAISVSQRRWNQIRTSLSWGAAFVSSFSLGIIVLGAVILWFASDRSSPSALTFATMLLLLPLVVLLNLYSQTLKGLSLIALGQLVEGVLRPLGFVVLGGVVFLIFPESRSPQVAMFLQVATAFTVLFFAWFLAYRKLAAVETECSDQAAVTKKGGAWLRNALPFTFIAFAMVINGQADILMVGWLGTKEQVGLYRVAVQAATLVVFSVQVANTLISPKVAAMYANGQRRTLQKMVTRVVRWTVLISIPIAVLMSWFGGSFAALLFGDRFVECQEPLMILALAQLGSALFGSVGLLLNMTGHQIESARYLWISTACNLVLNWVLIPLYGMTGAALATGLSLLLWNVLLFWKVHQKLGINPTVFRFRS